MKKSISITLSEGTLKRLDGFRRSKVSRSAVIERALCEYLPSRNRSARAAKDIARINAAADVLNAEALDVLEYQA